MSALCDYVGLALDVAVTAYLIKLHRKECVTISNMQNAPSVDVGSDLVSLLNEYPDQKIPYAVIRGRVAPVDNIVESSTGVQGVMKIVSLHEITAKRFGDSWDDGKSRPLNQTREAVPFALTSMSDSDAKSSHVSVTVENPFDSLWENLLLPTSSAFTPANSTFDSALLGSLGSSKVIGVRKTEKFLPIGTVLTGIGQIVKDASGKVKICEPCDLEIEKGCPYVLTTISIEELVSKLEMRKTLQRMMIGATITFGLVLLSKRVYSAWKTFKMKKLRESILRERQNTNLEALSPLQTCQVCLLNPREVILLNCGHVCVCADCVLKVNGLCPICREQISSTHKAYIP